MLIVWMVFGSTLLSSFSMSAFYCFLKYLHYTANRHRQADKFYNSCSGFDSLGATYFLIHCEIETLIWVARDPYYGYRWFKRLNQFQSADLYH